MALSEELKDSPGGNFISLPFQMKVPHLDFLYRLSCEMSQDRHYVGAPFDGTQSRLILPIVGGVVKGPRISATIQHMSGADWGTKIRNTDVQLMLDSYPTNDRAFALTWCPVHVA
jgi:hypothetical protein